MSRRARRYIGIGEAAPPPPDEPTVWIVRMFTQTRILSDGSWFAITYVNAKGTL